MQIPALLRRLQPKPWNSPTSRISQSRGSWIGLPRGGTDRTPACERAKLSRARRLRSKRTVQVTMRQIPLAPPAEQTNLKASCAQLLAALPAVSRQTVNSEIFISTPADRKSVV